MTMFLSLFNKLPYEIQSKILVYFMDICHKNEVYELKKLIKQSLFIDSFFTKKIKFPEQVGKKHKFFNVQLLNNKFHSFEDYHTYNVFMNLIENGFEIIDYRRFRYLEENWINVTFIEYTLEINIKKDNKIFTKFFERTNSSYDRFNGKNYFEYLQYVSYDEYKPDDYEDKYVKTMNTILNIKY